MLTSKTTTASAAILLAAGAVGQTEAAPILTLPDANRFFIIDGFDVFRNGDALDYDSIVGYSVETASGSASEVANIIGQITEGISTFEFSFTTHNVQTVNSILSFSETEGLVNAITMPSLQIKNESGDSLQTVTSDAFGEASFSMAACSNCSLLVNLAFDPTKQVGIGGHFQFLVQSSPAPVPLPSSLFLLPSAIAYAASRARRAISINNG